MGISPHIARLRAVIGHELLVMPCVTVLPVDERGRMLLAWHAGHTDGWGTVGGAVDPGESPAEAAVREAREEIGAGIRLVRLLAVLGGPDYEVTYPNGTPSPSDGELSEVAWFTPAELQALQLSRFTRAMLTATGH